MTTIIMTSQGIYHAAQFMKREAGRDDRKGRGKMKSTRSKKHTRQNSKEIQHDKGMKNKKRSKNKRKLMNYRKVKYSKKAKNKRNKEMDKTPTNKKRNKMKTRQKLNKQKRNKKCESCQQCCQQFLKSKRQTESSSNLCATKMMLYAAGSKKATVILKQVNKENYFYIFLPKDVC